VSVPTSVPGGGGRHSGRASSAEAQGADPVAPAPRWTMRRVAGAAGLGYVAGVSIENQEILEAPTLGNSAADIRSAYEDESFAAITAAAGALALVFFLIFAVALFYLLRRSERRGESWALMALLGGVVGPLIAAVGQVANILLIGDGGLSSEDTRSLFDLYVGARMVAGVFVAVFLLGTAIAALRSCALPARLAWLALAIAIPIAFAPLAVITSDQTLEVAVSILFGLETLWIFLTSLWLVLANGISPATFVRRAGFLVLVLAAGLVGIGLLAAPGATGKFFAWELEPEPLAAFAGGVYVGSAALYAVALPRSWRQSRGFVAGAVVLSVSILVVTLTHLDVFDFDRLQAWAWVALFAGFSVLTLALLALGGEEEGGGAEGTLAPWPRALLVSVAVLLGALAVALWIDPTGLSDPSPFTLPPLGGRFAGSWIALGAVLAAWAAAANRRDEARLAALGLIALPAGALVAALRTISDLEPTAAAAGYVGALALLVVAGTAAYSATKPEQLSRALR
jgi:hypothetical protein